MPDPVRESSSDSAESVDSARALDLRRAAGSAGSWARFLTPAILGLATDLWLKAWSFPGGVPAAPPKGFPPMLAGRHPLDTLPVLDHLLGFQTTVNYGAVFGIWQGMAFYFLLFSLFAMALILWVFLTSRASHWAVHIALGMITAGALGNLYDRAMFNGVRDMLRFYVPWWPFIFNIADVMLCIGVPLLMLRWLTVKDTPSGK